MDKTLEEQDKKHLDEKKRAEQIVKTLDKLVADRANYDGLWQDISKYVNPRKAFVTRTQTEGQKLDSDVYDSTAIYANTIMAAGIDSLLTNSAQQWFQLKMLYDTGDKDITVWLQQVQKIVYDTLNNSNFSQEAHECYLDIGPFGMFCLAEEEDAVSGVRFSSRPPKEIYIEEDAKGNVIAVYRKFQYTVRQAYETWGENSGKEIREAYEKGSYTTKKDFIHYVGPREKYDPSKRDKPNMPFESIYLNAQSKEILEEGGYRQLPYFIPRFNRTSGNIYGSGPGHLVYAEISMVNRMYLTLIRSAEKMCDPPIMFPHKEYLQPIKYYPGAINYKTGGTPQDRIEFLNSNGNLPINLEIVEKTREIIKAAFSVNLFMMMQENQGGRKTATEVIQLNAEKLMILSPMIGQMMSEYLNPLIERTIDILASTGRLPEPPESYLALKAKNPRAIEHKIIYTSPLAKSQRLEDLKTSTTFMAIAGEMAQFAPDVLDNINTDEVIKEVADIQNIPAKTLRSKDEVTKIREMRMKQQQQMQQMQMMQMGAQAAQAGAQAGKTTKEATQIGQE